MSSLDSLPVAVIGAGPIGMAAAAHLVERGLEPLVLERGPSAGSSLLAWKHVRVFSPWLYNVDEAARTLLAPTGWTAPDPDGLPTGGEIVERYLEALANHPAIAPHLVYGAEVTGIARSGLDKMTSTGREGRPFVVRWREEGAGERRVMARAVIDASGVWGRANPIGVDGMAVEGETKAAPRIAYGLPDVSGTARDDYAGKRVLVIGGGHSAVHAVLDLLELQESDAATEVVWAMRRPLAGQLGESAADDQLPARASLGTRARRAIDDGRAKLLAPFAAERVALRDDDVMVTGSLAGEPVELAVHRIVVATGFRPDLSILRELRVVLDPVMEAPPALAPLIDPNHHSCGTVPPHGAAELAHPETGFYIVGSKSYGRAPTFLMRTGYEQVRSVVAEIAGDHAAARSTQLVLPTTGVCGGRQRASAPIALESIAAFTRADQGGGLGSGSCCG